MLKINNKQIPIDKIISFGCSFTAGDELLDHKIHPDSDIIKRTHGMAYWKEKYETEETIREYKAIEQTLSWAGQVASKLGIPFEGKALGGSSMEHSLFALEKAIASGEITPTTLVLFGTTTKERIVYFNRFTKSLNSLLLSYQHSGPSNEWDSNTILDLYNDEKMLWHHLLCLNRILQISEMLNDRLQVFETIDTIDLRTLRENTSDEVFNLLRFKVTKVLNHKNYHSEKKLLKLGKDDPIDRHGGNHPRIHIHQEFASYVISKLT